MGEEQEPRAEEIAAFFDLRADGYDAHMEETVSSFEDYYRVLADPIVPTKAPIRVLDIGCGTGLKIAAILERAPNARIVGIDLSERMLDKLCDRYAAHIGQITIRQESYLTAPLGEGAYDYALAVMMLHHLLPGPKRALYERIRRALALRGAYIEGDYVVTPQKERMLLRRYEGIAEEAGGAENGSHHIDIPFSMETQRLLLREAGFGEVEVIWQEGEVAIYVAWVEHPPQPPAAGGGGR